MPRRRQRMKITFQMGTWTTPFHFNRRTPSRGVLPPGFRLDPKTWRRFLDEDVMSYQLKGGEEWRDGKLYGWTGRDCPKCHGSGEIMIGQFDCAPCPECGHTGEEWGLMPVQPEPPK